jgi:transcriptional regulator with XRE-family HTH domain
MADQRRSGADTGRRVFGERIRALRHDRGLSQERLAELAGVHRTYLSSLERGERNVSLDNIYAIAEALGVSPADLFESGRTR